MTDTTQDAEDTQVENSNGQALSEETLKTILEALVFASAEPVAARRLARLVGVPVAEVEPMLEQLCLDYENRGISLQKVAGGFQFRSASEAAQWVQKLIAPKPLRLTRAQLETIAILAYRQPITRPEVEDIRGVDCGSALQMLGERGLIKILGRKDEPGRPLLYGTTPEFLSFFGLESLRDLPTLREFSELSEQHRTLFAQELGEMELGRANEEAQVAAQQIAQEIGSEASQEIAEVAWVKEVAS